MSGEWGSANKVFGPGRYGEILMVAGGNLQTKDEDEIGFTENGLVIRHHDPADSISLIPWVNIRMIRTALTEDAMRDQKRRAIEKAERATKPVLDVEALKAISSGDV